MKIFYIVPLLVLAGILSHPASAEVYVPDKAFAGYFDHDGKYAVYGFVRNTQSTPVIARVGVTVSNGSYAFSESRILPMIYPLDDMPFRFIFPQVEGGSPVLQKPDVAFFDTNGRPLNLAVDYDRTLVKFPDGHLTGFIANTGNTTVHDIDVFALVHDRRNDYLDEVQSAWTIPAISPGGRAEFAMYPDPAVAKDVYYYSCFIPGTDNVVGMSTQLKGRPFYFSVLSIVYFTNQKFGPGNTELSLDASNPWQITYPADFMFPKNSSNGDFKVLINGREARSLTSQDTDSGNWHVAFNVPYGQQKVVISGFNPVYTPDNDKYFYLDAKSALGAWAGFSTYTISDSKLLQVLGIHGTYIPPWVKTSVGFMIYKNVPPQTIVDEIKYLQRAGIVR
ncbi:MAG: hypothetical protein KGI33_00335 [Thaumarchaeota archaeon]|nr:hypothetical protein [Nitrososphaerota archaeon]